MYVCMYIYIYYYRTNKHPNKQSFNNIHEQVPYPLVTLSKSRAHWASSASWLLSSAMKRRRPGDEATAAWSCLIWLPSESHATSAFKVICDVFFLTHDNPSLRLLNCLSCKVKTILWLFAKHSTKKNNAWDLDAGWIYHAWCRLVRCLDVRR